VLAAGSREVRSAEAVGVRTRHARGDASGLRRRWRGRRDAGVIVGRARIDARTKNLLHRLQPGDIAVILHEDLDQAAAEGLVERGAAAVINCHRSITGRYPNAGPLVLSRARVPLVDAVGEAWLAQVNEGDALTVRDGAIVCDGREVARGVVLDGALLDEALSRAQAAMGEELERFVRNTMEYIQTERDLVLRGGGMPDLRTEIKGRHCVVIVRGNEHKQDLQTIRSYINEMKPALIAVDGAADALLDEGLKPSIIIGDMDSVSTHALTCGAEIVVHAYPDGRAPGLERVSALGLEPHVFSSAGTSEDIALLLAYEKGADLIVAVGAHDNMVEFLDKGRAGMASTFIVRLKVGPKLVDAKGVNRLYRSQVRTRDLVLLVASAVAAMGVAAYVVDPVRLWIRGNLDLIEDFLRALF
ncbi:MAG TPA: putative cytokinetic ring protein SteA, partial [Actinomycetota bacterium]|nr:putative cytokinetic ring protein SteA [Actinomycetota bacterium]